jgi:hypothetical protein
MYDCPPPLRPENEVSHIEKYHTMGWFPLLKRGGDKGVVYFV